jgi:hypothetical protein
METYRNTKPGEEPAGGQPGSVRYSVPPPGPRLEFDRWCRVLTAELRRLLPERQGQHEPPRRSRDLARRAICTLFQRP